MEQPKNYCCGYRDSTPCPLRLTCIKYGIFIQLCKDKFFGKDFKKMWTPAPFTGKDRKDVKCNHFQQN